MAVTALVAAAAPALAHDDGNNVLRAPIFPATKAADGGQPIFGVQPGGANWVIDRGEARVRHDGRIRAEVRGLVFAPGEANAGTNTVPRLAATLYCNATAVGTTKSVPFSTAGNAEIRDQFDNLPRRCGDATVLLNPAAADGTVRTTTYIAFADRHPRRFHREEHARHEHEHQQGDDNAKHDQGDDHGHGGQDG